MPEDAIHVTAADGMLRYYNAVAAGVAADRGIAFVTVWEPLVRAEALLADGAQVSLYSDGIHLSPTATPCCTTWSTRRCTP